MLMIHIYYYHFLTKNQKLECDKKGFVLGTRSMESSVSSVPFRKITTCTNTPKYSLFDVPRTAEINCHKIIPDKLGCWYQGGGYHISMSSSSFSEITTCTN